MDSPRPRLRGRLPIAAARADDAGPTTVNPSPLKRDRMTRKQRNLLWIGILGVEFLVICVYDMSFLPAAIVMVILAFMLCGGPK